MLNMRAALEWRCNCFKVKALDVEHARGAGMALQLFQSESA